MFGHVTIFLIGLFSGTALGFFITTLCPAIVEWCTTKIFGKAAQAAEVEACPSGGTDTVEVPRIGEIKKYALRFGLPLAGLIGLSWMLKPESIGTVFYKITLLAISLLLCELVWLINYKPVFGKIEVLSENKMRSVLIFRGILCLGIILGITWGL
jgi:hypothetical protein